jgi:polyribonucleotide nucleotidyltransferase
VEIKKYSQEFAGRTLSVEIGRLAGQANGSCYVQYGQTAVLVTATMSGNQKDVDYLPLSLEYEEKYYAAGKIKASKWLKREARPSDEAVLSGRLIDRTLRPRFDHRIRNEIQIVATVLSFDGENDPDILALTGASLALSISDIPFNGPVAGVRVGRTDGKLVINPTYDQRKSGDFELVVSGTIDKINMLETEAKIVPEKDIVSAISYGFKESKILIEFQNKIAKEIGKKKKELDLPDKDEKLLKIVRDFSAPKLEEVLYTKDKKTYVEGTHITEKELLEHVKSEYADDSDLGKKLKEASALLEEEIDRIVHKNILESDKRPDSRKPDELRDISVDVDILPQAHGTGLFNRGTTQALSILTLAAPGLEQWVETMEIELTKKRFMHHYVFPPFSVGETGRIGGLKRRDIGHGALAEKALQALIPSKEKFPYTIRVVSEILSSNGSSSMASVCGSSLALMAGGVPIKTPAAGIAMGIMFDEKGDKYKILTDIQGPEDHHGDMDLKVAGTKDGITAMQMDVKIEGVSTEVLEKALEQAKKARLEILSKMTALIPSPRKELSPLAPRVTTMSIHPDKIRTVIGPQGKMINEIIEKTGVEIDIEQDGSVFITSNNGEGGMQKAIKWIEDITYEEKPGDEFDGKVTRLLDFGAMVEYRSGKEGLVHVSQISRERIRKPSDVLKVGQSVHVRVKNIDEYGRINLTMQ